MQEKVTLVRAGREGGSPGQGRSYSQAEVDALVVGRLHGFADVDVEEYRSLKEAKVQEEQEKSGDFFTNKIFQRIGRAEKNLFWQFLFSMFQYQAQALVRYGRKCS
jgi:hypothetical protein